MGNRQAVDNTGNETAIFGQFAKKNLSFAEVLQTEMSWCCSFILHYSKDSLNGISGGDDEKEEKVKIAHNCADLYAFLCARSISQNAKLYSTYQRECKSLGILHKSPSLEHTKMIWLFSQSNKKFQNGNLGGKRATAGKWMLFCNKHFLTHSYAQLQDELPIDVKDQKETEKESSHKTRAKQDVLLTELDYYWLKVDQLTQSNCLGFSAKVSTNANQRKRDDANGVIIVYCLNSMDKEHVLRVAQNIRTRVGYTKEEMRYKTDQATIRGQYGGQSHLYQHNMSQFDELTMLQGSATHT